MRRAAVGLVVLAGAYAAVLHAGVPNQARGRLLVLLAVAWAVFAAAAWLVLRAPQRSAVALVLVGGVALQVLAFSVPPRSTDDFYRYAWDGRVQSAGIDPYRYAPTDPRLSTLHDDWLFPGGQPRLNHPDDPTIYPPVAEAEFAAVHALSPPGSRHKPWQVAAALLAVATSLLLVRVLRAAGLDPRRVVLWAWCPTVVLEAGNNAHVDALAALLVVGGLGLLARRRAVLGGGLLGAAVAVKLFPLLVLPAALRHRPRAVVATAAGVVALAYAPHVAAVGTGVLGFLPGYLHEEGYAGTGRFALLTLVVPHVAAPYVAVAGLAAVALWCLRRADPDRPWDAAAVLVTVAFVVVGPSYPWYALLLVAVCALAGRAWWLAVAAAAYPAYLVGALGWNHALTQRVAYGLALAVVVASVRRRQRPAHHEAAAAPLVGDVDLAGVRLDDAAGDRQPQPGAAVR